MDEVLELKGQYVTIRVEDEDGKPMKLLVNGSTITVRLPYGRKATLVITETNAMLIEPNRLRVMCADQMGAYPRLDVPNGCSVRHGIDVNHGDHCMLVACYPVRRQPGIETERVRPVTTPLPGGAVNASDAYTRSPSVGAEMFTMFVDVFPMEG